MEATEKRYCKECHHTKGRLKISDIKPDAGLWGPILQAESGRIIAFMARHPGQHPKEEAFAQEQADAERLVEAWNKLEAAEGMAKTLKALHEFNGWYVPDGDEDPDAADDVYDATVDARIAWEQAGK